MTALRSLVVCVTACAVLGCEKEPTFTEPLPDYAAIHWVHAIPDTMQLDFRVVDMVSNAHMFDANYRANTPYYVPIEAGSRTVRVFLSSTTPAVASQVLQESQLDLTVGAQYTYIQAGFARTGQLPGRTTIILQDTPTAPAATSQIAIRIVNVGAGLGAVDAWVVKRPVNAATIDSLPDARSVSNLAFGAAATYSAAGRDAVAADTTRVVFTPTGLKTPILASVVAPAGLPGDTSATGATTAAPTAGSRVGCSVLTALLVPRSVAGSTAPQTAAFTTPTVLYLVDRRPPPIVGAPAC